MKQTLEINKQLISNMLLETGSTQGAREAQMFEQLHVQIESLT